MSSDPKKLKLTEEDEVIKNHEVEDKENKNPEILEPQELPLELVKEPEKNELENEDQTETGDDDEDKTLLFIDVDEETDQHLQTISDLLAKWKREKYQAILDSQKRNEQGIVVEEEEEEEQMTGEEVSCLDEQPAEEAPIEEVPTPDPAGCKENEEADQKEE